jgi:hypothetical protein
MHRSYPTSELAARERRLLPTSTLDPLAVLRSRSPTGRDGPKPERQLPGDRERKRTFAGFRSNAVVRPFPEVRLRVLYDGS